MPRKAKAISIETVVMAVSAPSLEPADDDSGNAEMMRSWGVCAADHAVPMGSNHFG